MQFFLNRGMIFRRAHCFSSVQSTKHGNINALKYELDNNPFFDRAFPHFKGKKPETTVVRKQKELDFIRSLGLKDRLQNRTTLEKAEHENYKAFVEGYRSPSGPLRYLSDEEKTKINFIINEKLEELEATGLTREEILYDHPTHSGLPLSRDPFFQYIKTNYTAREVLLKPGEEYTVQKIIDLALRQDIGPDPSQSGAKLKNQKSFHASTMGLPSQRKNLEAFDSSTYSGASSSTSDHYLRELVKPDRKVHEAPLTKAQIRKQSLRKINYFDVHWRNTELISQFVTTSGFIKNKLRNRLTKPQQKAISHSIKLSREMLLLPYRGYIKPSDRKSLTTLQEDVENSIRTAINIETGHVYIKGSVNEDRNIIKEFDNLNDNFDADRSELTKDYTLQGQGSSIQDNTELQLLEARMHAAQLKEKQLKDLGIDTKALREKYQKPQHVPKMTLENAGIIQKQQHILPPELDQVSETNKELLSSSFKEYQKKIAELPVDKFAALLIHEKATNVSEFEKKIVASDLSIEESLQFINQVRAKGGLSPLAI